MTPRLSWCGCAENLCAGCLQNVRKDIYQGPLAPSDRKAPLNVLNIQSVSVRLCRKEFSTWRIALNLPSTNLQ